jgi:toxin ParE1/3/4
MGSIHKRARARRDLVEHYVFLAENAGGEIAESCLSSVEQSFTQITRHPEAGAPLRPKSPQLAGLRKWPVSGFDNVLIFCLPRPGGVSIVRVLHGARDWWKLLDVL